MHLLASRNRAQADLTSVSVIRSRSKTFEHLPEDPRRQTAIVVDEDLGFTLWLGQLLGQVGLDVVPALNCHQALRFTNEFNLVPDVIVVSLGLPGVSDMLQTLRDINPRLTVINTPCG